MSKKLLKKSQGFTLIEVVIVLAIAALIMLIVFLAVAGAQKSRRDTQRRNDLGRVGASLESFAANNNGCYPESPAPCVTTGTSFNTAMVTQKYQPQSNGQPIADPLSGNPYTYADGSGSFANPTPPAVGTIVYFVAGRSYKVCSGLEQGAMQCITNG